MTDEQKEEYREEYVQHIVAEEGTVYILKCEIEFPLDDYTISGDFTDDGNGVFYEGNNEFTVVFDDKNNVIYDKFGLIDVAQEMINDSGAIVEKAINVCREFYKEHKEQFEDGNWHLLGVPVMISTGVDDMHFDLMYDAENDEFNVENVVGEVFVDGWSHDSLFRFAKDIGVDDHIEVDNANILTYGEAVYYIGSEKEWV